MSDLLRPLLEAIMTVRERTTKYRNLLEADETRTRVSLVDPILTALGWNPADPSTVALEQKIGSKSADYALIGEQGKPAAIVEAKKLGTSLGGMDQLGQVGMYALGSGVRFAALTDGDRWQLYDLKKVGSGSEVVFNVAISSEEPQVSALQLLALWRSNAASEQWRMPEQSRIPKQSQPPPPPPEPNDWMSFVSMKVTGHPPPAVMRFEDGNEWRPKRWWAVLQGTIAWLYNRKSLTEADMPFMSKVGEKPLIHLQTAADTLRKPKPVPGTPLMFQGHMSAATAFRVTKRLLSTCGHTPSKVLVRPHQ